ncbi:MAG: hypothetical protein GSR84_02960 [Desulfurococcales archaeon]|nr:hypothetical protein [Desulfurococcales archaeon]
MSGVRRRAEAAALASILVVLAVSLLAWDELGVRGLIGLMILAPSGVMLGYYVYDRGAPDRLYSIGLYSFLIAVSLVVLGVNAKYVAAGFLFMVAGMIIAYNALRRGGG